MLCREGSCRSLRWSGLRCRLHSAPGSPWKQGGSPLQKVAMAPVSRACHHQKTRPPGVKEREPERKHRRSSCFEILCVLIDSKSAGSRQTRNPLKTQPKHRPWTFMNICSAKVQIKDNVTNSLYISSSKNVSMSWRYITWVWTKKNQKSAPGVQVKVSLSESEVKTGTVLFRVSSVEGDRTDLIGGALVQPQPPDITALCSPRVTTSRRFHQVRFRRCSCTGGRRFHYLSKKVAKSSFKEAIIDVFINALQQMSI